jgi:hypothetical protein
MFDTLEDRIKKDEQAPRKQTIIKGAAILVISVVLFGGLYFLVRLAE